MEWVLSSFFIAFFRFCLWCITKSYFASISYKIVMLIDPSRIPKLLIFVTLSSYLSWWINTCDSWMFMLSLCPTVFNFTCNVFSFFYWIEFLSCHLEMIAEWLGISIWCISAQPGIIFEVCLADDYCCSIRLFMNNCFAPSQIPQLPLYSAICPKYDSHL